MHTFLLPPEHWREPWVLAGAEARHLFLVLRLGKGDEVGLMDGAGRSGTFRILAETGKGASRQALLEPVQITVLEPPASQAWLALGWNKAARRGWLLEKAAELRAGGVMFWQAERSQGRLPSRPKETWAAALAAGAKQSANPFLPRLEVLPGGAAALARAGARFDRQVLLWEDKEAERLSRACLARPGRTLYALGPEGGLSRAEAETLRAAGFEPAGLGPGVLRWETAALLALGLHFWASD